MNFEYIIYSLISFGVCALFIYVLFIAKSMKSYKQSRSKWVELQDEIKTGAEVVFNGIYGKVKRVEGDTVFVEVSPDTTIKIAKYIISEIVNS